MIEIFSIGGYNEVGRNMTAVKIDDEVVIFDMGLHIPNYIHLTEESDDFFILNEKILKEAEAIPQDYTINHLKDRVKAIIPTHAHLDHIGAIPYLAPKYKSKIIATPYTIEVLKSIMKDEKISIPNKLITLESGKHKISENLVVEFINSTHSIPQTVFIALHTPYGIILYCNDFKLDNKPTLGKKPDYKSLERIGKIGVKVAIIDSLYADNEGKTPSESEAKEMLKDVLLNQRFGGLIITTFSSHIARLKSIIECGRKMGRKILMLGRSMKKYGYAAENVGVAYLTKDAQIIGSSRSIDKMLRRVNRDRAKYMVICTGHQGEQRAILSRIANGAFQYKLDERDTVIFSCKVIPSEVNMENRRILEEKLQSKGAKIIKDVHVSGHASADDLKEFIELINPENIIPAHANVDKSNSLVDIATHLGYKKGKSVIHAKNGDHIKIK